MRLPGTLPGLRAHLALVSPCPELLETRGTVSPAPEAALVAPESCCGGGCNVGAGLFD